MIKIKHLMDPIEYDDGVRLWVEAVGLTRDMRQWCRVDEVWPLAPPPLLAEWYDRHPGGYAHFSHQYHRWLQRGTGVEQLRQLARVGLHQNITLLHQGDSPLQNTAVALHALLINLNAHPHAD